MGRKQNKYLGGGAGTLISAVWGVYSTFTTVKELPDDAGRLAKMIADPPVYAPWLLFVVFVLFLVWVFWGHDAEEEDPASVTQFARGRGAHNISAPHSTINIGNGIEPLEKPPKNEPKRERAAAVRRRPPRGDTDLRDIVKRIVERDGKQSLRGEELKTYIREIGHEIMDAVTGEELTVWARSGSRGREVMSKYDLQQAELKPIKWVLSVPGSWSMIEYTDVQFVSTEVDKIWPPADDDTGAGRM